MVACCRELVPLATASSAGTFGSLATEACGVRHGLPRPTRVSSMSHKCRYALDRRELHKRACALDEAGVV
jgi:hypothetical protein